eukprot:COSAG05_NODE_1497_length_4708_cov_2.188761_3_plen_75_part_00
MRNTRVLRWPTGSSRQVPCPPLMVAMLAVERVWRYNATAVVENQCQCMNTMHHWHLIANPVIESSDPYMYYRTV